jgi:GrpB-like predicted nucleotidyltransferase (UPF0157 family)
MERGILMINKNNNIHEALEKLAAYRVSQAAKSAIYLKRARTAGSHRGPDANYWRKEFDRDKSRLRRLFGKKLPVEFSPDTVKHYKYLREMLPDEPKVLKYFKDLRAAKKKGAVKAFRERTAPTASNRLTPRYSRQSKPSIERGNASIWLHGPLSQKSIRHPWRLGRPTAEQFKAHHKPHSRREIGDAFHKMEKGTQEFRQERAARKAFWTNPENISARKAIRSLPQIKPIDVMTNIKKGPLKVFLPKK